jgi:epoxyqueuosine reductase
MTTAVSPGTKCWTPELRSWLDAAAREAGFALAEVASVPSSRDDADARRFSEWVERGHAGEMEYLKRRDDSGTLLRSSVSTAFPWVRSVIVCALDYSSGSARSIDPAPRTAGWIARYAWSGRAAGNGEVLPVDYHDDLLARLRSVESALLVQAACETRCYVDTGPLLERAVAAKAGIGWIGKNTCVINQHMGSWLLLGVILTSLPLEGFDDTFRAQESPNRFALPAVDRCGTCTRCIDACPTGALLGSRSPTAPREMDASRCIAYLTIEKKGEIAEELRAPIGRNVFGCDICQEVCPWNVKAAVTHHEAESLRTEAKGPAAMQPRTALVNPELSWLAEMDSGEFRRRFRGSPLERTGRKRLLRNVAIGMGNSGERSFLPKLEEWIAVDEGAQHPNDAAIRDAAIWAREQILASHATEYKTSEQESGSNRGPGDVESVC